eukprot:m.168965 g.168965  ORF g.168965 m.168965 type:complete len:74 (-) comp14492_c0_seq1:131-352(-)
MALRTAFAHTCRPICKHIHTHPNLIPSNKALDMGDMCFHPAFYIVHARIVFVFLVHDCIVTCHMHFEIVVLLA